MSAGPPSPTTSAGSGPSSSAGSATTSRPSSSSSSSSASSSSSYYSDSSDVSPPPRLIAPPTDAMNLPPLVLPSDYAFNTPEQQRALLRPYEEKALVHTWDPETLRWESRQTAVAVESEAFAAGAMRSAHRLVDVHDPRQLLVAKRYKRGSIVREQYFSDVLMHTVAQTWALKFNAMNPPKPVYFLSASVVELFSRSPPLFLACEGYLEGGEFIKHNGNDGFVADQSRATPQSFSHFTYHHTKGKLLVCDMQGVGDFYTDPQLHTADGEGYGRGNLGKDGMQLFFRHHHCNAVCQFLRLPPSVTALFPMPKGDRIELDGTVVGGASLPPRRKPTVPTPVVPVAVLSPKASPSKAPRTAAAAAVPVVSEPRRRMTFLEWIISLMPFLNRDKKRAKAILPPPPPPAAAPAPLTASPTSSPSPKAMRTSASPGSDRAGTPPLPPDAVDPYTGAPALLARGHDRGPSESPRETSNMRRFREETSVRGPPTETLQQRLYGLNEEAWDF